MDSTRKLDLRPLLAVAAIAIVAVAIWATAALASGGSSGSPSSSDPGMSGGPPAAYVQDNGGDWSRGDCPERDGNGGSEGNDGSGGDSGQPSADL